MSDHHDIDFLGIGAQKAATSWLWRNLKRHPGVWMPPRKELHYFDRSLEYPSPSHIAADSLWQRLVGRAPHERRGRALLRRELFEAVRAGRWHDARWTTRYFLGQPSDAWYRSLFASGRGRLRGEITPSYSILDAKDVARVRELFPDLRVIYVLRNPIDRAWSHVRFAWTIGALRDINDVDEVAAFVASPMQALRSDYLRTLSIWRGCYPERQIHVGFYDEIVSEPDRALAAVLEFLGLPPLPAGVATLTDKVNPSRAVDMPPAIRQLLERAYASQIEELAGMFGGWCEAWRRGLHADRA
ncbi:MAG: sulfotransferase [Phycisphaerales bacterium]